MNRHHHALIVFGRSQAVDARHTGHDDHILAGQQRTHRRKSQPLDLIVDGGILLDVGVRARDVGLGLVVVEVAHEVLDRVVREEVLQFRVKLRRQRFVVRENQGRTPDLRDHTRHRVRFPGARHPEQRLMAIPRSNRLHQLRNRLRLVAARRQFGRELEG